MVKRNLVTLSLIASYLIGMSVLASGVLDPLESQLKTVDMSLEPAVLYAPPGETVVVYVTVTGADVALATLETFLKWDDGLELVSGEALSPSILWGFTNDPEGINDDVTDGEALFTILAPKSGPWMYATANGAPFVRLTFLVLDRGLRSVRLVSGDEYPYAGSRVYPPSPPGFNITGANEDVTDVKTCVSRRVGLKAKRLP